MRLSGIGRGIPEWALPFWLKATALNSSEQPLTIVSVAISSYMHTTEEPEEEPEEVIILHEWWHLTAVALPLVLKKKAFGVLLPESWTRIDVKIRSGDSRPLRHPQWFVGRMVKTTFALERGHGPPPAPCEWVLMEKRAPITDVNTFEVEARPPLTVIFLQQAYDIIFYGEEPEPKRTWEEQLNPPLPAVLGTGKAKARARARTPRRPGPRPGIRSQVGPHSSVQVLQGRQQALQRDMAKPPPTPRPCPPGGQASHQHMLSHWLVSSLVCGQQGRGREPGSHPQKQTDIPCKRQMHSEGWIDRHLQALHVDSQQALQDLQRQWRTQGLPHPHPQQDTQEAMPQQEGEGARPPPKSRKRSRWIRWTVGRKSQEREREQLITRPSRHDRWSPGKSFGPLWPDISDVAWVRLIVRCSLPKRSQDSTAKDTRRTYNADSHGHTRGGGQNS